MAEIYISDVSDRAQEALSRSCIFDLRRLSVEHEGDVVVLRGRVSSFYHKQLAQELVRNAIDGVEVVNAIHVVYSRDRREASMYWE